jgi:uncharacterized protein
MRLVDTSAWIEWLIDSPAGRRVDLEIPVQSEWIVPTIVQLELAKWFDREDRPDGQEILASSQFCQVVPLDTGLALAAAALGRQHALHVSDAIIYATAQHHGADLLTCDAHFRDLPGVIYVPKSTGTAS